jgi:hypothetical protein
VQLPSKLKILAGTALQGQGHPSAPTSKRPCPRSKSGSGYITGIALKLGKAYTHSKKPFITASCPIPKGTNVAPFPFAKAAVGFEDGRSLKTTLVRTCKSKG